MSKIKKRIQQVKREPTEQVLQPANFKSLFWALYYEILRQNSKYWQ